MKTTILYTSLFPLLLLAACSSNTKVVRNDTDAQLCSNHKADYQYFRAALAKEHAEHCTGNCAYTPTMTKNSDTMERIAGTYYLMNCDYNHGRL